MSLNNTVVVALRPIAPNRSVGRDRRVIRQQPNCAPRNVHLVGRHNWGSAGRRSSVISTNRGIKRRESVRKMTHCSVRQAAEHYETGESLKVVGVRFDVGARTLDREFKRAGIKVRPRRGGTLSPEGDPTARIRAVGCAIASIARGEDGESPWT